MQAMYDDDPMDDPDGRDDGRDDTVGTTPVTVHLPSKRVAQIQQEVDEGNTESFSVWVTEAVETKALEEHLDATETLGEVLDDLLMQSGGPVTDEERQAWARVGRRR